MISQNYEYYRPDTFKEAVKIFNILDCKGKKPAYCGGGTELHRQAQNSRIDTGAVIDIKGIPECNVMKESGGEFVLGAALTLNVISDANIFPLLGKVLDGVADNIHRDKITLGGNICGRTVYREAVMPFLIYDSLVVIAGKYGLKCAPINELFNHKMLLENGEFLVQIKTESSGINLPYICIKKSRIEDNSSHPVSIACVKKNGQIKMAFSGICGYPFRSKKIEECLNDRSLVLDERVMQAAGCIPCCSTNKKTGSCNPRGSAVSKTLYDIMAVLEGM